MPVFTQARSQSKKHKNIITFLGQITAPKSGKTVAPPASTSLI